MKIKAAVSASILLLAFSAGVLANTYGCVQLTNNTNSLLVITTNDQYEVFPFSLSSSTLLPGQSTTAFLSAYGSGHSSVGFLFNYIGAQPVTQPNLVLSVNHGEITLNEQTPFSNPTSNFTFTVGAVSNNTCVRGQYTANTYPFTINDASGIESKK